MKVDLLTKKNCPLCDQALAALEELSPELGLELNVIDTEADSFLRARHRYDLPLIRIDGRIVSSRTGDPNEISRRLRHARRMKDARLGATALVGDPNRRVVRVDMADVEQSSAYRSQPIPTYRPQPPTKAREADGRQVVKVSISDIANASPPATATPPWQKQEEEKPKRAPKGKPLAPLRAPPQDAAVLRVPGFPGPRLRRALAAMDGIEVVGAAPLSGLVAIRGNESAVVAARQRFESVEGSGTKLSTPLLLALATILLGGLGGWLRQGETLSTLSWIAAAFSLALPLLVKESRWLLRDAPLVGLLPWAAGLALLLPGGPPPQGHPFELAAVPMAIHLGGIAFLLWARRRIRSAILPPEEGGVPKEGAEVVVEAGEVFPADGSLQAPALVDESPLGGDDEAPRLQGEMVFAGSVALEKTTIRISNQGPRRAFAMSHAERGLSSGASKRLEPVLSLALPLLALAGSGAAWTMKGPLAGASVLLGMSPLALVFSLSLAEGASLTVALRRGIAATGEALIRAGMVRSIVMGKRRVLERGVPVFMGIRLRPGQDATELLTLAASAEAGLDHPIAKSIVAHAAEVGIVARSHSERAVAKGAGVEAVVDGRQVLLGSATFLASKGVDTTPLSAAAQEVGRRGATPVLLSVEGQLAGVLELGPAPAEAARQAVGYLELDGLETRIATGDHPATTQWLAEVLGLASTHAMGHLSSESKAALVEELDRPVLYASGGEVIDELEGAADLFLETARDGERRDSSPTAFLIRPDARGIAAMIRIGRAARRARFGALGVAVVGAGLALALPISGLIGPGAAILIGAVTTAGSLAAAASPWFLVRTV